MLRTFGLIRISSQDAWIPIILAHLIAAYPFVSRTVSTAYNRIDFTLIEMGKTLGASRWYIFRNIELPIISSGILAGVTFALAISFGEFGATYFIARSEFTTMTIGIYRFLDLRQLQNSAIMTSILILVCIVAFLLVQRLGEDEFQF
jgi:thiamine transport system permease protein